MDSKLTLKLNKTVIEKAKAYASEKKISLSRLIESYLQSITSAENEDDIEISSFVKSMSTGVSLPNDLDYKTKYSEHIIEKHN